MQQTQAQQTDADKVRNAGNQKSLNQSSFLDDSYVILSTYMDNALNTSKRDGANDSFFNTSSISDIRFKSPNRKALSPFQRMVDDAILANQRGKHFHGLFSNQQSSSHHPNKVRMVENSGQLSSFEKKLGEYVQRLKESKLDEGRQGACPSLLSSCIQHHPVESKGKALNAYKALNETINSNFEVMSLVTSKQGHKSKRGGLHFILADPEQEFDFFKILVLCAILCQPKFFMYKLMKKDPREMYARAKGNSRRKEGEQDDPLQFYSFYEWICNDIAKTLYNVDDQFAELEREGEITRKAKADSTTSGQDAFQIQGRSKAPRLRKLEM